MLCISFAHPLHLGCTLFFPLLHVIFACTCGLHFHRTFLVICANATHCNARKDTRPVNTPSILWRPLCTRTSFHSSPIQTRALGNSARTLCSNGWENAGSPRTRCNRTRQRPGPDNDHTIWLFSGPEILGPHNEVGKTVRSLSGPETPDLKAKYTCWLEPFHPGCHVWKTVPQKNSTSV